MTATHPLDAQDPLARFRQEFYLPPGQIYLDGNSLGLLSKSAEAALLRTLAEWKTLGIGAWMDGQPPWFFLAEELAQATAPLLGAEPDSVIVANSTTVNLHQLLATLYDPRHERRAILLDSLAFPTDRYAVDSFLNRVAPDASAACTVTVCSRDGYTLNEADIVAAMTDAVQIAILPAVLYTSGQLLDMARLTAEAHRRGVLIGFDCSHSIGAVPHQFRAWDVDFAFWCNYKYVNGGPGATGGLYLHPRHFGKSPGLAGWFGSRKDVQMEMGETLIPASGAGALQIGSPNILSMAPLHGALAQIAEAGIAEIRAKSLRLTAFLREQIERLPASYGFRVVTPHAEERRGGHIALVHPEAVRICKALQASGVVPDYRPPDIVRLAPVALYTAFADCAEAVTRLDAIMQTRAYENYPLQRGLVP